MTMTEWWTWPALFAAGLGLGAFFYGGLWWTVRRLPQSRHPALLMLASFALRAAVTVLALAGLMAGDWRRLAVTVSGLVLMRWVMVRRYRREHAVQS